MQLQQLQTELDSVATTLKETEQEPSPRPRQDAAAVAATATTTAAAAAGPRPTPPDGEATRPALPPGLALHSGRTGAEILADLNRSPLFMTELEENDDVEALRALSGEGTAAESATEAREHGNERFRAGLYADAREFYGRGVAALLGRGGDEGDKEERDGLLATLHLNRAAAELALGNNRRAWLDCAAALRADPRSARACRRGARALLRADRVEEAGEMCECGLQLLREAAATATATTTTTTVNNSSDAAKSDGDRKEEEALRSLAAEIAVRTADLASRRLAAHSLAASRARRATLIRAALAARSITVRATVRAGDMSATDADDRVCGVRLLPDPDDPRSRLALTVRLLYPTASTADLVRDFVETDTLAEHLAVVLPPPWDDAAAYGSVEDVVCYAETAPAAGGGKAGGGGLVRVGKKVSLLRVLAGGRVEIVDGTVRIFVVARGEAEGWVEGFKARRREMGVS